MRRLFTCGLAALAFALGAVSASAATLYRWVDAQGVVHYSDTPQPGAEKVQVQDAQTYKVPAARTLESQSTAPSQGSAAYQCQIVSPAPEQSFFDPEAVSIAVTVTPAPSGGDRLVVTVDGSPIQLSPNGEAQVPSPERGAHTITLVVRGADGKTACSADPVTFNVQRPSLLSPQSPAHH
jgi:hypothetical protein